jgi:large subunit ribosomal protein L19
MITQIDFKPGDIVRVHQKIKEGDKTRTQVFQGTVLKIRGSNGNNMFTVRKLVGDVAVERIFPVDSPNIEKVEVKGKALKKVRRAKLYFLRNQF